MATPSRGGALLALASVSVGYKNIPTQNQFKIHSVMVMVPRARVGLTLWSLRDFRTRTIITNVCSTRLWLSAYGLDEKHDVYFYLVHVDNDLNHYTILFLHTDQTKHETIRSFILYTIKWPFIDSFFPSTFTPNTKRPRYWP